jgi:hypothetical protein
MLFKGKLNLRNSVFSCFKKVIFLLSLVAFQYGWCGTTPDHCTDGGGQVPTPTPPPVGGGGACGGGNRGNGVCADGTCCSRVS